MSPDDFARCVRRLLDEVAVMTLATCGDGLPWATDVYFAPKGFEMFFYSSPHSVHCRNLYANPACAATVHPQASSWQEISGLQLTGQAWPVDRIADSSRAFNAYTSKFPFVRELLSPKVPTMGMFKGVAAHRFLPTRIFYLDNSMGFGTRYAIRLENGTPVGPPVNLMPDSGGQDSGAAYFQNSSLT